MMIFHRGPSEIQQLLLGILISYLRGLAQMLRVDLCYWFQTHLIKSGCGTATNQTLAMPGRGLRDHWS